MFILGGVVFAFFTFTIYDNFFRKEPPIDTPLPQDFSTDDEYSDESESDYDEIWEGLTESEKKQLLDNQLDEYHKETGKKSMLAWASLIGFNKGRAPINTK